MNVFLNIPFPIQIAVIVLAGALLAGQLNRGIYRLAWYPRQLGPWTPPREEAPARRLTDRIPVWGWIGLRREAELHGRDYWIRPLLLELLTPIGLALFYWWEMTGQLVPSPPPLEPVVLGWQFLAHAVLISFLIVATFIDVDEQTIPDAITVPGTLLGLLIVAGRPQTLLPAGGGAHVTLATPLAWPGWLDERAGLYIGVTCFVAWCLALTPKTWWTRSGMRRAVVFFLASMWRRGGWRYWVLAVLGSCVIVILWQRDGATWRGLLSGLVGMAVGGGMVWLVRIVAHAALGREAMGFGDVTLMAMIGSYLGWQGSVIIFFMAPFAGAVIAAGQYLLTRRPDIAYGPFLSAATGILLIFWADIWTRWGPLFQLGWLILAIFVICMVPMGVALWFWRVARG